MTRTIIHVDMDAFYASVEVRERPELAGRPVIVGGRPEARGVVSAASYEARRFGVHSAMPTATALRLCPRAVLLPPRHDFYAQVSAQIRVVFERYTPLIEPLSLDEAFLDVTGSERLFGSAERIGRAIKAAIRDELRLVASVGIAPNKFLAKLASDLNKPDGFLVVHPGEEQTLLAPLPVERLWGVGQVTAARMHRLGIRRIGQLQAYPQAVLAEHFGAAGAAHLTALARGIDRRSVVPDQEAKSISHETTFAVDISERRVLLAWLRELTEQVTRRLRRAGLQGRTVQLKVRYADFTTVTRSHTLAAPTAVTDEVWREVRRLYLERVPTNHPPVRLVGAGVSGFEPASAQVDMFVQARRDGQERLDRLMDSICERFGPDALRRGRDPTR